MRHGKVAFNFLIFYFTRLVAGFVFVEEVPLPYG